LVPYERSTLVRSEEQDLLNGGIGILNVAEHESTKWDVPCDLDIPDESTDDEQGIEQVGHGKNVVRFSRGNDGDSDVVVVESIQPDDCENVWYSIFRDCWKLFKSCLVDCAATLD
jgi:hypothetical protein